MERYAYRCRKVHDLGRYQVELGELATETGPSSYTIVHMRPFACCAASVDGRLALVSQYRYAVGSWQLELPAGGIEPGETPQAAAIRELREETGLVPSEVIDLGMTYPSAGSTDEECFLFAMRCEAETVERVLDQGEQIELVLMTRAEVERLMDEGSMRYYPLYVAWLKLARMGLLDELFPL